MSVTRTWPPVPQNRTHWLHWLYPVTKLGDNIKFWIYSLRLSTMPQWTHTRIYWPVLLSEEKCGTKKFCVWMQCIGVLNIDIDTTSTNLHYTISRLLCVKHIYKKPLPPNIVHSSKYRWQNWGTELVHIYTVYCEYCDCTDPVCVSWHFMCPALGSNQSPSLLPQLGTKLPRFCQRSKNIRNRLRPGFKIGSQSISETERLVWAQPSPAQREAHWQSCNLTMFV